MRALLLAPLVLSACVVAAHARGIVSWDGEEVILTASNAKARPLAGPATTRLRHLDGVLVDVEGTFRGGVIEVESWRVSEGPTGFTAFVGTLGGGLVLAAQGGGSLRLHGEDAIEDGLEDEIGEWVLVEGIVDGPQRLRVLGWRPLHE